jgi:hypothetical protein
MAKFAVSVEIRNRGAIGAFQWGGMTVEAKDEQDAIDVAVKTWHGNAWETRFAKAEEVR